MSEAGKGDTYRQVDYKKWSENYDLIFGPKNVFDMSFDEYMNHLIQESSKEDKCPECLGWGTVQDGGMFSEYHKCDSCGGKGK